MGPYRLFCPPKHYDVLIRGDFPKINPSYTELRDKKEKKKTRELKFQKDMTILLYLSDVILIV